MKARKSRNTVMKALQEKFVLNAVPSEDFDGSEGGIWIRDDICKPETDYYPYAEGTMQENELNTFLTKAGWFAEPYDSETIMIYRS